MKVLIAEDDAKIRKGLAQILTDEGYLVVEAANGREAISLYHETQPDFVCLDIMMPEKSGYEVCREIRAKSEDVPIIFISAKSEEIDKVLGLELGADDYILKPFGVKEVTARIRAVTRRYFKQRTNESLRGRFSIGGWEVDSAELCAEKDGKTVEFSLREVSILELFARNVGKVLERDTIFDACWGIDHMPNSRTLDQHISKLRKKIESDPKDPKIIRTVHGAGYRYSQA
jgi:DNA-binding response OmpR family regulator